MGGASIGPAARGAAIAAATLAVAVVTAASYAHPLGDTTVSHSVAEGPEVKPGYFSLVEGPGWPRLTRTLRPEGTVFAGRENRRGSLAYFAQLTDFQLADEESPVRVEFLDPDPSGTARSSWRPQEAFHPWVIDWSFRQLNEFTAASPHPQAGGARAAMDFGLLTGDQSDNQQLNETIWVRQLVEGGQMLNPNSGVSDYSTCTPEAQLALSQRPPDEAQRYTGVQDYEDYFRSGDYYDPDEPFGKFGHFPRYEGLMDRAQRPFLPVGLRRGSTPVPTYAVNGNHDGLVQGNDDAIRAYEDIAIGCFKPFTTTSNVPFPDPGSLVTTATGFFVPPDDERSFVDRIELKLIYKAGTQRDGHGFGFIDPQENRASGFAASYYAWDAKPGLRFIALDTVADGGVPAQTDRGNIDNAQWLWLQRELKEADDAGKLIVVVGHHPIRSLTANVPDEAASPCTGRYTAEEEGAYTGAKDQHGHDPNPGCDLDPRVSQPLRLGPDLVTLLSSFDNVVAYVAGHTHENRVLACGRPAGCPEGGNWWEINTSATADWPQQHRVIELMDNADGTLSIFATLSDHASKLGLPPETSDPSVSGAFDGEALASLGRSFSYNDPQSERHQGSEGRPEDRNVELLVDDPRTNVIRCTEGNDVVEGTEGDDVIICGGGNDVINARGGNDIVRAGSGNDVVLGSTGNDRLSGDSGKDRLLGGRGNDRLFGRSGQDRLFGQSGRDRISAGSGLDRISGGNGNDRIAGSTGNDRVNAGQGNDVAKGESGKDRLAGDSGNDRMSGGSGNDRLAGQEGNDRLVGSSGRDLIYGGSGRDLLVGGPGRDRLFGGPGRDRKRR